MKSVLIKLYRFNLAYAKELVLDVDQEDIAKSPAKGLENHPAFTLGHLVSAAALTAKYLGAQYDIKKEWEEVFRRKGPGDPKIPSTNTLDYPSKSELIEELERQHNLVEELIAELDESRWNEPTKWRFSDHLPSLGDLLYFMCVTHEAMHLSQLAAWRRSMGLNSALSKL